MCEGDGSYPSIWCKPRPPYDPVGCSLRHACVARHVLVRIHACVYEKAGSAVCVINMHAVMLLVSLWTVMGMT